MTKIGFYQFYPVFGQVSENLAKVVSVLKNADTDLIVLPELPFTGYCFQNRDELKTLAEDPSNSRTIDTLINLCRAQDFFLVTGFAERCLDKLFNSALLIGPEGVLHTYRKLHLFNTEKKYFDKGDTPLEINNVRDIKIVIMICYDWAFPEVALILELKGADLLCHPTNLVLPFCQQAMHTRCLENKVFAITANRYGRDVRLHGKVTFTGQSQIVAPRGELLYRAKPNKDKLYIAKVDIKLARDKSISERNDFFKDRRPSYYQDLCKNPL